MQTLEGLHLFREAHITKYACDGRVEIAVFVLVLTNEHEYVICLLCRYSVLLEGLTARPV
jgi:hypothetical protein